MASDSQWPVQQAIYTALTEDATLISYAGDGASPERARVYDDVPQDSAYPFVVIGEGTAVDWDTKTTDGMEQTVTIHTWDRPEGNAPRRGSKRVKQMMAAIVDALDDQALSVTGHTLVNLRLEFSDSFKDEDGQHRHGVQRFRVVTESN